MSRWERLSWIALGLIGACGAYYAVSTYQLQAEIAAAQVISDRVQLHAMDSELKLDRAQLEERNADLDDLEGQLKDAQEELAKRKRTYNGWENH